MLLGQATIPLHSLGPVGKLLLFPFAVPLFGTLDSLTIINNMWSLWPSAPARQLPTIWPLLHGVLQPISAIFIIFVCSKVSDCGSFNRNIQRLPFFFSLTLGHSFFINLQEHTEELQKKAMSSLFSLVCNMYKVHLMPIKLHSLTLCTALLPFYTISLSVL